MKNLMHNPDHAERLVHKAQRIIWNNHTFEQRGREIMAEVVPQLLAPKKLPRVSVLVSSIRPHQISHVVALLGAQRDVDVQLVYLAHGFTIDEAGFRAECSVVGLHDVVVLQESREKTLGECLNLLVEQADGEYGTKWDDDDFYGPLYLSDQVNAVMYSGAEVVGKRAHYMHLTRSKATILRNPQLEHRYVEAVAGPTIFGKLAIFQAIQFAAVNRGEDTQFLQDVRAAGGRVYSSDRYNYCQMRQSDTNAHTWHITDDELMSSSKIQFFGTPEEHVLV